MRRLSVLLALVAIQFLPAAAFAAEDKCPLPLTECLMQYQRMRERPWLGVMVDQDSVTHQRIIVGVVEGGPAERAGLKAGDVLLGIEGRPPAEWFASKAGWKDGDTMPVAVDRGGAQREIRVREEGIPEETLAKMIGVHMLEGHLAYMHGGEHETHEHH